MLIPALGEIRTQTEISALSKANNFEMARIGNPVEGGMLLTLSRPGQPIQSSWLLVDQRRKMFKRVF